jgi:hypothetical protein
VALAGSLIPICQIEISLTLVRWSSGLGARPKTKALTGPSGLLRVLTKTVIETALDEEST